jgi:hypothetical protein
VSLAFEHVPVAGCVSRALVATALAQVMAGVVALICGWGSGGENWPRVIFISNGFFAALWLGSARLS